MLSRMASHVDTDRSAESDLLPMPPFERPTHLTGEMKLLYELLEHQHTEMMLVLGDILTELRSAATLEDALGAFTDRDAD